MTRRRGLRVGTLLCLSACIVQGDDGVSPGTQTQALISSRAMLASPGLDGQPIKGVFYFPGEWLRNPPTNFYGRYASIPGNESSYTLHPADARHLGYSEATNDQTFAVTSMAATGANVIVMSYWGPPGTDNWMFWAPMQDSQTAQQQLFDAVGASGKSIVVLPSIEDTSPTTCKGGTSPGFRLAELLPYQRYAGNPLLLRVYDLVDRFIKNPSHPEWANRFVRMYDVSGLPRFVIQLKDVGSTLANKTNADFSAGFASLASDVKNTRGVDVGFTLDPIDRPDPPSTAVTATPDACGRAGAAVISFVTTDRAANAVSPLASEPSVLGIQAYRSEIKRAGGSNNPYAAMITQKRLFIDGWIGAGLPVIADVSAGYDGHLLFSQSAPYVYGHSDEWRNDQSQLRSGSLAGLVFTAWNGFTEGWAGMPTLEASADGTDSSSMNRWLANLFSTDPRQCNHMQFVNGVPTYSVYGLICSEYYLTGGTRGPLGAPVSSEHGSVSPGVRRNDFANGVILWKFGRAAHEVHGAIATEYARLDYEGPQAPGSYSLGVPTTDEQSYSGCGGYSVGRYNQFEYGKIIWCPGWSTAAAVYP